MDILFYVEPLIEMGRPYWKEGWATSWAKMMLKSYTEEHKIYIAINTPIAEKFGDNQDFHIVTFSQEELLKPFKYGYLEATGKWYNGSYNNEELSYYIDMMKRKFSDINFDIILTYTKVPFFKELYPNAKIFHMEFSIFSRIPFPSTWYLDCVGLYEYNFLMKYVDNIKSRVLSIEENNMILQLQNICIDTFRDNNIFVDDIKILRKQFDYLVLLPLQFSLYTPCDPQNKYSNQYDYLTDCLRKIPKNIGVIFTMHPEYPILDDEAVEYITKHYANAVFLENSRKVYSASQWIMPYIDAVVTVSSSLGLQTLLFRKKLFAIGGQNMAYIADAQNLDNMEEVLAKEPVDRNNILWFFITKYAIPQKYLFNSDWLMKFFEKSLQREITADFYDDIAEPEQIFEEHIKEIQMNKNKIPQWTSRGNTVDNKFIPVMYVMYNGNYTGEHQYNPSVFSCDGIYDATFDITGVVPEKYLRIDPLENQLCSMEVISIDSDGENVKIQSGNFTEVKESTYTFFTDDPILQIYGDFENATYIRFKYRIKIFEYDELKKYLTYDISTVVEENSKIKEENSKIKKENTQIKEENIRLKNDIIAIKSTRGYRLLEKIRKLVK